MDRQDQACPDGRRIDCDHRFRDLERVLRGASPDEPGIAERLRVIERAVVGSVTNGVRVPGLVDRQATTERRIAAMLRLQWAIVTGVGVLAFRILEHWAGALFGAILAFVGK